jgi:hypothetical protein
VALLLRNSLERIPAEAEFFVLPAGTLKFTFPDFLTLRFV